MTTQDAKNRIDKLTEELKHHNYLYYVVAEPVISDTEFDLKLKELEFLEKEFPEFAHIDSPTKQVGGAVSSDFITVPHKRRMMSLGNTYNEQELREFDARIKKTIGGEVEYVCELKIDGLAISLFYENGKLVQAVTRGDGVQGDDVTQNVRTIRSVTQQLHGNYPESFEIRGEIFMHRKGFERLNAERTKNGEAPYANPRNVASGSLKIKDSAEVAKRPLDITLYHFLSDNMPFSTHFEAIEAAKSWGIKTAPETRVCKGVDEVMVYIHDWDVKRHELGFDTDGVVIKVNNLALQEELGFTAKVPRWAIAYKYQTESATTELLGITYQVGRTGAITPVAELNPVHLLGTTVKRASLHNANEIERLDVRVGDIVFVEKGGEIIPKITGVDFSQRKSDSTPTQYITNCPECATQLVRNEGEAQHYCPNEDGCKPQIIGKIEHFVSKKAMNIEGMGSNIIEILIDNNKIKNYSDLYNLKYEDLIGLTKWFSRENSGLKYQGQFQVPLNRAIFVLSKKWGNLNLSECDYISSCIVDLEGLENTSFDAEKVNLTKLNKFIKLYKTYKYIPNGEYYNYEGHVSLNYLFDLKIKHLNNHIYSDFLYKKNINYIDDYLNYTNDIIILEFIELVKDRTKDSIQDQKASSLVNAIHESKKQPFEKVLFALGIKDVGETTAKTIAHHFKKIENLYSATVEELSAIQDIGPSISKSINRFFNNTNNINVLKKLELAGLTFEVKVQELTSNKLQGKTFVISGTFDTSRESIKKQIEENGGKSMNSLSKNTSFLICGDNIGQSKFDFAKKNNISMISIDEFNTMLK